MIPTYPYRQTGNISRFSISFFDVTFVFVGIFLLAPMLSNNQWTIAQFLLNPMEVLLLLASFSLLILNGIALFHLPSPVQLWLGLLAAIVCILMYIYLILQLCLYSVVAAIHNIWPPNLFDAFALTILCLPLLGFLLNGASLLLTMHKNNRLSAQPDALPITHNQQAEEQQHSKRQSRWVLNRRRIIAMLVGVLLYALTNDFSIIWAVPMSNGNTIILYPAIFVALIFGIAYGPWTGLATGGLGYLLSSTELSLTHIPPVYLGNWWKPDLASFSNPGNTHLLFLTPGFALIGFIAGLPFLTPTQERLSINALCMLTLKGLLATLGGLLLMNILLMIFPPFAGLPIIGNFSIIILVMQQYTLPTLAFVAFILPPLLKIASICLPEHAHATVTRSR